MNMQILDGRSKPIHVALFQTKEERKAILDQQHQMNTMRSQLTYPIYIQPQVQGTVPPQYLTQPRQQFMQVQTPIRGPYMSSPMTRGGGRGGGGQRLTTRPPLQQPTTSFPPNVVRPRPQIDQQVPNNRPPGPTSLEAFMIQIAKASPEEQKHMLGEKLFPLVYKERPADAAKITGMILELEVSELLSFLESGELLKKKVQEAVRVLEEYIASATQ